MTKRIVLFGGSGVGKSSLINLLLDLPEDKKAKTSDSAIGCTMDSKRYERNGLILYDTAGLDEGSKGTVSTAKAIVNLIRFLEQLEDGIHLLLFVIRKDRIKKDVEQNYKLFYEIICRKKVPIVLVITGCETENEVGKWWTKERLNYEGKYEMTFQDTISGCASIGEDEHVNQVLAPLCQRVAEKTKEKVLGSIARNGLEKAWTYQTRESQNVKNTIKMFIPFLLGWLQKSKPETTKYRDLEREIAKMAGPELAAEVSLELKEVEAFWDRKMNIVVFGETGTGKSSLIRMMLGENAEKKTEVSDSAVGCTLDSTKFVSGRHIYHDTAGLGQGDINPVPQKMAIAKLVKLLRNLEDGVNLLVYVIWIGKITKMTEENYKLFVQGICQRKVPTILVITGCEMELKMGDWYRNNKEDFEKEYMFQFKDVISACTSKGEDKLAEIAKIMKTRYKETEERIRKSIQDHALQDPWRP